MSSVLVAGATGYVGGRLVPELLAAGHAVRCVVRDPAKLGDAWWRDRVEVVRGDVTDAASMDRALDGVDVAYYLVHSMAGSRDFEALDRTAATCVAEAAARAGTGRIVYLGGLGRDDDPHMSPHLGSRHEVGRLLASGPTPVTELRAAIIIGSGSASFEMLRYLVEVLPVMVAPRWVDRRCQPIAVRDVLAGLVAAIDDDAEGHHVVEVGGPDVLTYREMMSLYAEVAGLAHRIVIPVPVLTPRLSSLWVSLVTPLPANLARPLVDSLVVDVVVTRPPGPPFPDPATSLPFRDAVALALQRSASLQVATRWSDASLPGRSPSDPMPTDAAWAGGSILVDEKVVEAPGATPESLFRVVAGIGGDRGWYVTRLLWEARGWIDKLVGGVGMRRGRRHPDELWIGDALDFWRVEAVEPDRLVRLRAEMRLPGQAWLEWRIEPDGAGGRLEQRAIFAPKGLAGRAYWYALLPFHAVIFGRLAARLTAAATAASGPATVSGGAGP
ncbi:SDR family oxidoreductase [Dermatobacter hominis]|uniref:SDR family oxidoreductase n=1 Tax=Dermatobacter hominis TaxID=2884263 RepID=UPI001D11581D|nr:SDR family oxidoreductase [Dermatobacter hominis]UDY36056.1 SDR family oxidoreductase [Dermatobacter hominis]